jgi:brefeldin A-resistance guanine nucleotide exchange factor 1
VETLLDELPEDDTSAVPVITVKSETIAPSPVHTQKQTNQRPTYDPAVVYILEFCTVLALRDEETIELLGKQISEALQAILRDSSRYHPILVSRAAFYQFSILKASYVSFFALFCFSRHANSPFLGARLCTSTGTSTYDF